MKLIIFDMDGLMVDTERVTCQAYLEVANQMGYHATTEQYIELLGLSAKDIMKKYNEFFGEDMDAKKLFQTVGIYKYELIDKHGLPAKKGLYELLDAIDLAGVQKAVASSSDLDIIEKNLELVGVGGRFDYILSAKDPSVKRGKPFPDIFLEVCKAMKVAPGDAVVLEDSNNGIRAALAGGIPVIGIPDMVPILPELEEQSLAVVEDLSKVIEYLPR